MPSPAEILSLLGRIANDAFVIAVAWHVTLGAALLAMAVGPRSSRGYVAALAIAPLASVSVLAFAYGVAFNGVVLGALVVALSLSSLRRAETPVEAAPPWAAATGAAMIAFGWTYPHFLNGNPLVYLYGAPLGLLPCPTLSAAVGVTLIANGLGSRGFSLTLATAALFYGLFGAFRLGVAIDLALIVGALALAGEVFLSEHHAHGAPRAA